MEACAHHTPQAAGPLSSERPCRLSSIWLERTPRCPLSSVSTSQGDDYPSGILQGQQVISCLFSWKAHDASFCAAVPPTIPTPLPPPAGQTLCVCVSLQLPKGAVIFIGHILIYIPTVDNGGQGKIARCYQQWHGVGGVRVSPRTSLGNSG